MTRFTLPARLVVIYWPAADVPAVLAAPTAAEIADPNAVILTGTSQGEAISEMSGWEQSPSVIETPDYVSHLVGNVPGDTTIPESSISIYMDDTDRTIYDSQVIGNTGAIGIFFDGTAVGAESNIYLVEVQNRRRAFARDAGHQATFDYSLAVPVVGAIVA